MPEKNEAERLIAEICVLIMKVVDGGNSQSYLAPALENRHANAKTTT